MTSYANLGAYPVSGPKGREDKVFYKLTEDDGIKLISGTRTPALLSVWASSDVMQFGTIKLLSGGPGPQQTELDEHPGDAVFYVTEGPMTFYLPDTKETFDVAVGDYMFLPEHTKYKIINYYGHSVKAVFMIAPEF